MEAKRSAYRVELATPFDESLERVIHELGEQGFGVLTWVDMKDKLVERLGADFRPYVIMGVFDPELAQRALETELDSGLVLISHVVVYQSSPGRSVVAAQAPTASFSPFSGVAEIDKIARDTDARIRAVIQSLKTD